MKRILQLDRLVASTLLAVALAGQASAERIMLKCVNDGSSTRCAAGDAGLTVQVLDSGDGKAAIVIVNEGPADFTIDQIYVEDAGGTLIGPPEILNKEPEVIFEWTGKQKPFSAGVSAGAAFNIDPDLSVSAQQPGGVLGINSGESLGLVYDVVLGKTLADVINDLSGGKLRFGVSTVDRRAPAGA